MQQNSKKIKVATKINQKLTHDIPGYARNSYQTYLTAPEWRNVDMAVEMADFLNTGNPFYRYPYFRQIKTFWYIFFQSLKAAHNDNTSWFKLIFSEFTLMNSFVGVWTTAECLLKGLISIPLWLIGRTENKTQFQQHVAKIYSDYQEFIHHTPFFLYSYFDKIGPMWKAYWRAHDKSFADLATLLVTTLELLIRTIPSLPARMMYAQSTSETEQAPQAVSTVAQNIHVLLRREVTANPQAIELPNATLCREKTKNNVQIQYSDVVMPRYVPFQDALVKLANDKDFRTHSTLKRIAGNDSIMVDFVAKSADMPKIKAEFGKNLLFSYGDSIHNDKVTFAARLPTESLLRVIHKASAKNSKFKLKLIHDF